MMKYKKLIAAGIFGISLLFSGIGIASAAPISKTYVNTYFKGSDLKISPSAVAEVTSSQVLQSLKEADRPSNAIVRVDETLNVVDSSGASLGAFSQIYSEYFASKVIPVVYVETQGQADAFSGYINQTGLLDVAVCSNNPALVKKVREEQTHIRGIIDYSRQEISDFAGKAAEVNSSYANVVILNMEQATVQTVSYFHARLKAVWVRADGDGEFDFFSAVSTGAYGIITTNVKGLYEAYQKYEADSLPRSFFNIAHRGLPYTHNENSMEGFIAAYESGATHVEVDVKVTKDSQLIIMHDDDISRTTNGTGNVNQMTLEQLRAYRVTKTYDGKVTGVNSQIPTLREVLEYFKGKDCVVIVEIKNTNSNFCQLFRSLLEELDCWDNVIVISFDKNQLMRMRDTIPEIPTANLNGYDRSDYADALMDMAMYNMASNPSYGSFDYDFLTRRNNKDRGFLSYNWTYDTVSEAVKGIKAGIIGLTNNRADQFGDYVRYIDGEGIELTAQKDKLATAKFQLNAFTYKGETKPAQCEVFSFEDKGDYALAILKYSTNGYVLYSPPVEIRYIEGEEEPVPEESQSPVITPEPSGQDGESSCAGCGGAVGGAVGIFLAAASLTLLKKKER